MNEKIRELVQQAEEYTMAHYDPDFDGDFRCKFAELLIKKCIEAASDPGDGLIRGDTWHDGVRASVWSIQKEFNLDRNFGVEP